MPKKRSPRPSVCRNLVVVSDTHCGCVLGLCPPQGALRDDGGTYMPSKFQQQLWGLWEEFWGEWVPRVTHGEPYDVLHNGDAIDGVHHNSTTQISHNFEDQITIAEAIMRPVVERCRENGGRYYHIRGTAAHVGQSSVYEEMLAKRLGALSNVEGQHARYDIWLRVGDALVHALHHIGTTSSAAYESSALMAEGAAMLVEAARWGYQPPDYIIRSHRHRSMAVEFDTARGYSAVIVTPGWQGKTPFSWRIPGARVSTPQMGGLLIRQGDEEFHYRRRVWTVPPSEVANDHS